VDYLKSLIRGYQVTQKIDRNALTFTKIEGLVLITIKGLFLETNFHIGMDVLQYVNNVVKQAGVPSFLIQNTYRNKGQKTFLEDVRLTFTVTEYNTINKKIESMLAGKEG
jgi:hypothetical protein